MIKITKEQLAEAGYSFVSGLGTLEVWSNQDERVYYDPKDEVIAFRYPNEGKTCVKRF